MGDASEKPWSDNPYAPRLPSTLYFGEKETFAGSLIGAIFYGTLATGPSTRSDLV